MSAPHMLHGPTKCATGNRNAAASLTTSSHVMFPLRSYRTICFLLMLARKASVSTSKPLHILAAAIRRAIARLALFRSVIIACPPSGEGAAGAERLKSPKRGARGIPAGGVVFPRPLDKRTRAPVHTRAVFVSRISRPITPQPYPMRGRLSLGLFIGHHPSAVVAHLSLIIHRFAPL